MPVSFNGQNKKIRIIDTTLDVQLFFQQLPGGINPKKLQKQEVADLETACPLCNALIKLTPRCECGGTMSDSGPVTDYSGPYSPYYNTSFEYENCYHLFTCPACGNDQIISAPVSKIGK